MDRIEKIQKLFQYGWKIYETLQDTIEKLTDDQLSILEKLYAAFHGLSSVADVLSHLNEVRFCRHPDTMVAHATLCKWPDSEITWDVTQVPPGFAKQKYVECAAEALRRWSSVSGVRPQYAPGDPRARIVMGVRSIDGQMGVLAESELPCGRVAQCRQWYDTGERWGIFDGAAPRGGADIDIVRVMCHELGHALGMNHIGAGNLLAPTYSQQIWTPQAGDVREMVARYGEPGPNDPGPNPGAGGQVVLRFTGPFTVDGYRVTRLMEAA